MITKLITSRNFDRVTNDQLRRASFRIMLNIAEGSSRFSNKDRKNSMVVAKGSAFECAAILEYLYEVSEIDKDAYYDYRRWRNAVPLYKEWDLSMFTPGRRRQARNRSVQGS
ncbi:MAG: four helix bundle protein [Methanosarcinaceae archaeon]|nr:four helix bundle protein [Methanosarcinaceae archaeon]